MTPTAISEWNGNYLDREMQVELEMNTEGVSGLLQKTPGGIKKLSTLVSVLG